VPASSALANVGNVPLYLTQIDAAAAFEDPAVEPLSMQKVPNGK